MKWLIFLLLLTCPGFITTAQTTRDTQWQPIVEMEGLVFPSFILANANRRPQNPIPTFIGDFFGRFGISILSPQANCKVKLVISVDEIATPTTFETVLPKAGERYDVFPYVNYRFAVLKRIIQPFPANVNFQVSINNGPTTSADRRVQIRPVNECPFAWSVGAFRDNVVRQQGWMFAAFVNEDHPWIDGLLSEALQAGTIESFIGYQGTKDNVIQQVFAIWNVLQRRGFRYSSITTTSGASSRVYSQYVRFLSDSIRSSQANCVDGSVLIASVLRKIGIDTYIILLPGHCLIGLWLDANHTNSMFLETTMLGNTNLKQYSEEGTVAGDISRLFGYETRNQASYRTFSAAVTEGFNKVRSVPQSFPKTDPRYQMIDIGQARKNGIATIGR